MEKKDAHTDRVRRWGRSPFLHTSIFPPRQDNAHGRINWSQACKQPQPAIAKHSTAHHITSQHITSRHSSALQGACGAYNDLTANARSRGLVHSCPNFQNAAPVGSDSAVHPGRLPTCVVLHGDQGSSGRGRQAGVPPKHDVHHRQHTSSHSLHTTGNTPAATACTPQAAHQQLQPAHQCVEHSH